MGTVEGSVRFLQLLSCWVRVKPWVFLAFGDWKPLALDELAGGFMLTPLVMRSHPPVKIWWDWRDRGRYSKEPTLPLWWTLQISDFGRNPVEQNFHLFGGEWPHCRGDDADSTSIPLPLSADSVTPGRSPHFQAKGTKSKFAAAAGTSQACSDADLPVRVAGQFQVPWVWYKSLSLSSGGPKHGQNFAGGCPALQWSDVSVGYGAASCSSSPLVRTAIILVACYEEHVCVCTHTEPEKSSSGHCYSDSTVWIQEIGPWGEKAKPLLSVKQ